MYEKYLELETDSAQEFEQKQDEHSDPDDDLFEKLFRPFNTIYSSKSDPVRAALL